MGYTAIGEGVLKKRVSALRQRLKKENMVGLLIFNDEFRPYYSMYISDYKPVENLEFSPQGVYISQDELILFLGKENVKSARQLSWISDIRDIQELTPFFLSMTSDVCLGLCGIEKLPHFYKKVIDTVAEHVRFLNKDNWLDELRMIKSQEELVCLRDVAQAADDTVKSMLEHVEADYTTEKELAAYGEYYIRCQGMDYGYDTIVASGKNTMDKTWRPSQKTIKKGDVLLINMVPRSQGYCSFLTVTHAVHNPNAQAICTVAKKVIKYMTKNIKPGDTASKIYDLYYQKTKEYGLLEHFLPFNPSEKSIGHSIGLEVVEHPYLQRDSQVVLQKNMVLSLKYNLYNFDFGDIRFEFSVWIDDEVKLLNQYLFEI